jgi:hypothetical protein
VSTYKILLHGEYSSNYITNIRLECKGAAVANTIDYYMATITAVKSFILEALGDNEVKKIGVMEIDRKR